MFSLHRSPSLYSGHDLEAQRQGLLWLDWIVCPHAHQQVPHADHGSIKGHQNVPGLAWVNYRRTGDRIDPSGAATRGGRLQADLSDFEQTAASVGEGETVL
jgi:hypothetical protein